ncbi:MAG: hypothetical protein ACXWL8_00910 [Candidatus Limnocylindria bacterium]
MAAVNPNVVLPLASSLLSFAFAALVGDQWLRRRQPYQLVWTVGLLWYGISAGTEFLGGAFGWSGPLYRAWYLIGAVMVAGWLGLGTVYLLARTRFGYAFAASLLLAGLFTLLSQAKYNYAYSGPAPFIYFGIAIVVAVVIAVMTFRGDARWAHVAAAVIVGGSLVATVMAITAHLTPPGYSLDPATLIPTGEKMPGYLRLLTPFFNITGAFALGLGALYSTYTFMEKRRVIRYSLRADRGPGGFILNLLLAPVAILVNLLASLPGAVVALFRGRLSSRVPATILIAIGATIPAFTSGANRFGATSAFFVGELLGILFLFAGFLVSIEVFSDIRLPFTRIVLVRRKQPEPPGAAPA